MKKNIKTFMFGSLALLVSASSLAAVPKDITVKYENQRGSIMNLTFHTDKNKTGTLTGSFTTAVGDCKTDVGVPMPLTGYFNGNAIAVTVNFPDCKKIAAMTGNVSNDFKEMDTLWLAASPAADPKRNDWDTNIVGADQYHQIH